MLVKPDDEKIKQQLESLLFSELMDRRKLEFLVPSLISPLSYVFLAVQRKIDITVSRALSFASSLVEKKP